MLTHESAPRLTRRADGVRLAGSAGAPSTGRKKFQETRRKRGAVLRRRKLTLGKLVVGELIQEVLDEVGSPIAKVDVVGVLPHIECEQRLAVAVGERILGVRGLRNFKLAVLTEHEPRPARAELSFRRLGECLLEFRDAAKVRDQFSLERARYGAARGREASPEETVVPVLACVIEHGRELL